MNLKPFFFGSFIFVSFSAVGANSTEIYPGGEAGGYPWTLNTVAQVTKYTPFDMRFFERTYPPKRSTLEKDYCSRFENGLCAHLKKQNFSWPSNKKMGEKALDYACRGASPALVSSLLQSGVNPHICDEWGRTLLMKAVSTEPRQGIYIDFKAKAEIVKLLVAADVDVTAVSKPIPASYGSPEKPPMDLLATAFYYNVTGREIINFIVEKLTTLKYELLPSRDSIHLTMIGAGHFILLNRILKERPPVLNKFFKDLTKRKNLLLWSFSSCHYDRNPESETALLQILLEHGADVNGPDKDSPLFKTIERCNLAGTKLLLDYGANLNIRDNYGDTPLHYAVRMASCRRNEAMVKLLLNYNRGSSTGQERLTDED